MDLENKIKKLEEITTSLESKSLSIDESLKLYNEAIELSKTLVDALSETKGKLKILNENLELLDVD
jgi:exodeoxyribonuclease VII small subunit